MPFTYQTPRPNAYAGSIADLMLKSGSVQAQGAEQIANIQGQALQSEAGAWAGAARNIGTDVQGAIQTATDPRRQLEAGQVQQQHAAMKGQQVVNGLITNLTTQNPDGSRVIDRAKLQRGMAASNIPLSVQEATMKSLDDVDKSISTFQQAKIDHMADLAHGVLTAPGGATQANVHIAAALAKANGLASDDQLAPILAASQSGQDLTPMLSQIRGLSEKYKDLSKPMILPSTPREGGPAQIINPMDPTHPLAVGSPSAGAPPTESSIAMDAATVGTAQETPTAKQSAAALAKLKPNPQDNATKDKNRYIDIQMAAKLGQPVSDADKAWAAAYVNEKTIGPEAASAAASLRQANTIAEQNAIQRQNQNFQQAQAGRKELGEKVEQPYQTAINSANTLRDVVAAAKGGNKVAGSLQSLETTMAAIRAQGLNRINTAEIGVTANAGNIWDNIVGKVGKLVAGEPVPADLQKDMTDFADILEKAAYKKYEGGWDTTVPRYKLTDEVKLPPPSAPAKGTTGTVGGKAAVWDYRGNKWGWYAQ